MPLREIEARSNTLLATLERGPLQHLLSTGQFLTFDVRTIVKAAGASSDDHVWFPIRGSLSILAIEGQRTIEIGSISVENLFTSTGEYETEHISLIATTPGVMLKVTRRAMTDAQIESPNFARAIAADQNEFAHRCRQAIACLAFHPLPQRLALWLTRSCSHTIGNTIVATQGEIARFLSVERSRVNVYLQELTRAGIIEPSTRGSIRVIDCQRLRSTACTCVSNIRVPKRTF